MFVGLTYHAAGKRGVFWTMISLISLDAIRRILMIGKPKHVRVGGYQTCAIPGGPTPADGAACLDGAPKRAHASKTSWRCFGPNHKVLVPPSGSKAIHTASHDNHPNHKDSPAKDCAPDSFSSSAHGCPHWVHSVDPNSGSLHRYTGTSSSKTTKTNVHAFANERRGESVC